MNLDPKENFEPFKKMLGDEICTDLEIHVGRQCQMEGEKVMVKCHRAILAAGSQVFQKMFESGMKEVTGNKIEIEEMSEQGVRAMLAYLYDRDIKAAYESSEIALELLQAAEKYDIGDLKYTVREYMMAKESGWFGVDVVLNLFVFCKALCSKKVVEELEDEVGKDGEDIEMKNEENRYVYGYVDEEMEAWKDLKIKCLKVIKWYTKKRPNALLESERYQEIFGGNLKLGMEISSGMLRLN